ncbi:MAG: hypothetical protein GY929_03960 [Actinomycetia bacterium]|nr:hypothetical protein [Actinomycetes bacterium]
MSTTDREFIFGVDLDGVCADYTAGFRQVVAADRGVSPDSLGPQLGWDYKEWGVADRADFERLHRRGVMDERMFRDLPVVDGAAEALWRLSDAGVWIRIITHRIQNNWGHAVAVADTVHWLDSVGIPYRDICFLGQKPQVEADAYVDDAPHNIAALRAAGNQVIVFDTGYNQGLAGPRATDWLEVEAIIGAMLEHGVQTQLPGVDDPAGRLHHRLSGGSD